MVITKANQFISFKFGDIQLLDILNFPGGATSLDSFSKASKTSETKRFFPYEWFDHPDKMQITELTPYDAIYSNFCSCSPLEAEYDNSVILLRSGDTTERAVVKLRPSKPQPAGVENFQFLQQSWKHRKTKSLKIFLRSYNNEDVLVWTLKAMQKMIAFYHEKNIDMLKFGFTLQNLANICPHKPTDTKFYLFKEPEKDLLEKKWEDVVAGRSIVITRKRVVDETFIRKSTNICKSIVGIDAGQLYPYSLFQPRPTRLYTHWDLNPEIKRFIRQKNKTSSFESVVLSYFQPTTPDCRI